MTLHRRVPQPPTVWGWRSPWSGDAPCRCNPDCLEPVYDVEIVRP